MIKMIVSSSNENKEEFIFKGKNINNMLSYNDEEEVTLSWGKDYITMSNGLNLKLMKMTYYKINTPLGDICLQTKLTNISINKNSLEFEYTLGTNDEIQDIRKIKYRW